MSWTNIIKTMNHLQVYNALIEKAKTQNRIKLKKTDLNYVYYENHHILPRCLNGSDNEDNLILLTLKEHYVAHKLLTYIYPNHRKIVVAYHMMTYLTRYNKYVSSKDIELAIKLKKETIVSKEKRNKLSIVHKGKPSHNKGKIMTDEQNKK